MKRKDTTLKFGRPSLLDEETLTIIVQSVENGLTLRMACANANVSYKTIYEWKRRGIDGSYNGREGNEEYEHFADALTRAEEQGKASMLIRWQQFFPTDYRAIRDYMARRWPDEWGATERVDLKHSGTVQTNENKELADIEELCQHDDRAAELIAELYRLRRSRESAGKS